MSIILFFVVTSYQQRHADRIFTGVIVWYIARPNLTVIVVLVVALAVYDFWRELWGSRKG